MWKDNISNWENVQIFREFERFFPIHQQLDFLVANVQLDSHHLPKDASFVLTFVWSFLHIKTQNPNWFVEQRNYIQAMYWIECEHFEDTINRDTHKGNANVHTQKKFERFLQFLHFIILFLNLNLNLINLNTLYQKKWWVQTHHLIQIQLNVNAKWNQSKNSKLKTFLKCS
jgi:hypothetical protein